MLYQSKAGYRDQQGIEKLLIDQMKYENSSEIMTVESLMNLEVERNFTVPDILPSPFTVLLFGSGGDGKSMSAWSLAKHVATGSPFSSSRQIYASTEGSSSSFKW